MCMDPKESKHSLHRVSRDKVLQERSPIIRSVMSLVY